MQLDNVKYETAEGVAVITLNRPERLNALNRPALADIHAACDAAEAADDVAAVVLTGAGANFCSGFDLKEQAADPPVGVDQWRTVLNDDLGTILRFWHLEKPTISAVRGHALAGGFELAMSCDLTVAATDAVFGEPELMFGAGIVALLLPWLTTPKLAKELILSADDKIPAARAHAIGLVNRVVPVGSEVIEARRIARRIAKMDRGIVKHTKQAINRSYDIMGFSQALAMANDVNLHIEGQGTEIKREFLAIVQERGLRAAVEWRNARYQD